MGNELIKAECYICKGKKECFKTLIYDKKEYKNVYLCVECFKKRYGGGLKGRATKVYSVNREKLKEAIEILDDVSKRLKDMLKKTEGGEII